MTILRPTKMDRFVCTGNPWVVQTLTGPRCWLQPLPITPTIALCQCGEARRSPPWAPRILRGTLPLPLATPSNCILHATLPAGTIEAYRTPESRFSILDNRHRGPKRPEGVLFDCW